MHDSGERKEFAGGGMRDTAQGKERFELLWTSAQPYEDQLLTRMAHWMARGAEKYESRNWEQFDGPEAEEHAKASLLRHVFKFLSGQTDEDHAAAVVFNVQAIELVRWKKGRSTEPGGVVLEPGYVYTKVEPPKVKARYWKAVDGDVTFYYRLDGEAFTTVPSNTRCRTGSAYRYVDEMKDDCWSSVEEATANELPEWAR